MNEHITRLIADARIALDNIENHPSMIFKNASASWLYAIGQEIQQELSQQSQTTYSGQIIDELRSHKP